LKDNATELDWLELSNSVDAILGLAFHRWIPPRVHQENLSAWYKSTIRKPKEKQQAHRILFGTMLTESNEGERID